MKQRNYALFVTALLLLTGLPTLAAQPVYIGFDAEQGHLTSTSDDAIREGILTAIDEINEAGGVLNGRPLKLLVKDNRSVPARGLENLKDLSRVDDLIGVYCGKFSPVCLTLLPYAHEHEILILDPWAAANSITDNNYSPNYAFRLSLRDSWAMPHMIDYAKSLGAKNLALMLPNNAWGRSNQASAERTDAEDDGFQFIRIEWHNWGTSDFSAQFADIMSANVDALIMVVNEKEGAEIIKLMATQPKTKQIPIISHWGITGGNFHELAGDALNQVDLATVQTFTFIDNERPQVKAVIERMNRLFGPRSPYAIASPVGVAHSYDMTHLLAMAINQAGSTNRAEIRNALENLPPYSGLIRDYNQPFTSKSHEALSPDDLFMARYRSDGAIIPLSRELQ